VAYVSHLAQKLSPTSIPGYLNVVRLLHVEAGLPNPLCENWEITLLKRGINRLKGKPPQQKLPITIEFLRKIRLLLDMKMPFDVAFWAALLVGFYGFLRKSTLLPSGKLVDGKFLARQDVVDFSLESFTLIVRHSKVIQFGQKCLCIPFSRVLETRLCPVLAMLMHRGLSPLGSEKPLFNFIQSGVEMSLSHTKFVSKLKSVLSLVGVDSQKYSAHSLRRGGASFAFRAGLSPLEIKQRGDWASSAFERYIHMDSKDSMSSSQRLASGVVRE
jgi:hypothetical protein